jgi:BlaI family transcriptional regulator, penicillinase repressor
VLPEYYHSSITTVVMSAPQLRLGDLQLRILEILWDRGEASVADVHAVLKPERELAYTTVATMLRKMEARELVSHREEGRTFLYHALVQADAVTRSAGEHFVGRLFEGSLADAVSHLLTTREVSRTELDQIEKMIREAKRRAK